MSEIKPNHICKNPECRKHYYACDYCDRSQNYKSVACSFACYQKYVDLVIEERSKGRKIDVKPERTDMTENEINELLKRPMEDVLSETKEELKEYIQDDTVTDFSEAVEKINKEIDKEIDIKKTTVSPSEKTKTRKDKQSKA